VKKEGIMLIRTTKAQVQPGQVDEFVRRWQEHVAPHVPEMAGLRSVYLVGNRDHNTVMTIHLWDTPPDQAAHEIHDRARFRDHVRDILAVAEPVAEEYEVLAHV
jgi:heme-degrading monooxygenase HmoA